MNYAYDYENKIKREDILSKNYIYRILLIQKYYLLQEKCLVSPYHKNVYYMLEEPTIIFFK